MNISYISNTSAVCLDGRADLFGRRKLDLSRLFDSVRQFQRDQYRQYRAGKHFALQSYDAFVRKFHEVITCRRPTFDHFLHCSIPLASVLARCDAAIGGLRVVKVVNKQGWSTYLASLDVHLDAISRASDSLYSDPDGPWRFGPLTRENSYALEGLLDWVHDCFYGVMQIHEFLRKSEILPGGPTEDERKETAWVKTLQTESECGNWNMYSRALDACCRQKVLKLEPDDAVILRACHYIGEYIERHLRYPNFEEIAERSTFGPGTTVGSDREIRNKISGNPPGTLDVNEGLASSWGSIVLTRYYPGWAKHLALEYAFDVDGVKSSGVKSGFLTLVQPIADETFTTVPKDWQKYRPIAPQTTLASLLQAGVGRCLEDACARAGNRVNAGKDRSGKWVEDPQALQKARAVQAYFAGDATIDFSSCSEKMASELIARIWDGGWQASELPRDTSKRYQWLKVMQLLRSRTLSHEDHVLRLERFSATGNGFTFPLMTLLILGLGRFACIEAGVDPRRTSVFGDDLIVPNEAFDHVRKVSELLGLRVNAAKSYGSGHAFRESCGEYVLWDRRVTPVRFSSTLKDERFVDVGSCISLANGLYRAASGDGCPMATRAGFLAARGAVLATLPTAVKRQLSSTFDLGDSNLLVAWEEWQGVPSLAAPFDVSGRADGVGYHPAIVWARKMQPLTSTENWQFHEIGGCCLYYLRTSPREPQSTFSVPTGDEGLSVEIRPGFPYPASITALTP